MGLLDKILNQKTKTNTVATTQGISEGSLVDSDGSAGTVGPGGFVGGGGGNYLTTTLQSTIPQFSGISSNYIPLSSAPVPSAMYVDEFLVEPTDNLSETKDALQRRKNEDKRKEMKANRVKAVTRPGDFDPMSQHLPKQSIILNPNSHEVVANPDGDGYCTITNNSERSVLVTLQFN